jgi:hypothetical protein
MVLVFRRENNGDVLKQWVNHFTTVDKVKLHNSPGYTIGRLFEV